MLLPLARLLSTVATTSPPLHLAKKPVWVCCGDAVRQKILGLLFSHHTTLKHTGISTTRSSRISPARTFPRWCASRRRRTRPNNPTSAKPHSWRPRKLVDGKCARTRTPRICRREQNVECERCWRFGRETSATSASLVRMQNDRSSKALRRLKPTAKRTDKSASSISLSRRPSCIRISLARRLEHQRLRGRQTMQRLPQVRPRKTMERKWT